ncbi:uncharacterized protein G2W53_042778 [Senna tora]|uniref:Uncharacterized protein n=1 Tax=Senna tora TaxID=362788 RepID=A0A834SHJ3_9FABA|nr:uncharacterized protein G2W53_042778 [Senna tora]
MDEEDPPRTKPIKTRNLIYDLPPITMPTLKHRYRFRNAINPRFYLRHFQQNPS